MAHFYFGVNLFVTIALLEAFRQWRLGGHVSAERLLFQSLGL